DPTLRTIKSTSIGYQGLTINIGNRNGIGKPYDSVGTPLAKSSELRRAFELALDRELINKIVFGNVHRPNCFPFPAQNLYAAAEKGIPCHLTANLAAAKAAFKRSGATAPVDVHLTTTTTTIAARLAALIQAEEKPVGFNIIQEPTEFATALSR